MSQSRVKFDETGLFPAPDLPATPACQRFPPNLIARPACERASSRLKQRSGVGAVRADVVAKRTTRGRMRRAPLQSQGETHGGKVGKARARKDASPAFSS